jgi:uncharacterized membrane protein
MKKFWFLVYHTFNLTIVLKAINGILEVAGGLTLLFGRPIERLLMNLVQYELAEQPANFISQFLFDFFTNLTLSTRYFISTYLIFHGLVNLFLVISLWRRHLWAFPVAIILFSIFVTYQFYRLYLNYSLDLLLISIFDVLVIILTFLEYRRLKLGYI